MNHILLIDFDISLERCFSFELFQIILAELPPQELLWYFASYMLFRAIWLVPHPMGRFCSVKKHADNGLDF